MNLIINNRAIIAPMLQIVTKVQSELTNGKLATIQDKQDNIVTCPFHKADRRHPSQTSVIATVEVGWFRCFTVVKDLFTKVYWQCFNAERHLGKWLLERFGNTIQPDNLSWLLLI